MADLRIIRPNAFMDHHAPGSHPECPERVMPLLKVLESQAPFCDLPTREPSRSASELQLIKVHSKEMVKQLLELKGSEGWLDADTYYNQKSIDIALLAAGSCIEQALAIYRGEDRRAFSFMRPPGHHATVERSMGFCLLNHVALAAASILEEAPKARVAIVDFDLHHGNGTQDIFNQNPQVLFVSSHRYPFYPGTGGLDEVGLEAAKGTKMNFPLNQPYGEAFFVSLYEHFVGPMLLSFKPDLILVSAGFDGHLLDPMQGFRMNTHVYQKFTEILVSAAEQVCDGKIFFCLEGGYHPEALAKSATAVVEQLMKLPKESFKWVAESEETSKDLDHFKHYHSTFFPEITYG